MNNDWGNNPNKPDRETYMPSSVGLRALPLIKDKELQICYIKCERLAAALHIISSHLSDSEPIRKNLRDLSLSLLSSFEFLVDEDDSEGARRLIGFRLLEINSLISVASVCGHVSSGIAALIQEQIGAVSSAMVGKREESLMLPSSFFEVDLENEAIFGNPSEKAKSDDLGDKNFPSQRSKETQPKSFSAPRRAATLKNFSKTTPHKTTSQSQKAEERRSKIISVLKRRGELALKDIAKEVGKDCSEKTLQRDLSNLSEEGTVEKRGNKRWSTYVLKNL